MNALPEYNQNRKKILFVLHLLLTLLILILLSLIFAPFVVPILWAIILTLLFLPIFNLCTINFRLNPKIAALLIVLGSLITLLFVLLPLTIKLYTESKDLFLLLENKNINQVGIVSELPFIGDLLNGELLNLAQKSKEDYYQLIKDHKAGIFQFLKNLFSGAIGITFSFFICFLSVFFFLVNSKFLSEKLISTALVLGGKEYLDLLISIKATVKATLHSMLLTALAQGALAGVGYYIASAPFPTMLALATTLASLIPFGPPFIYIPVAIMMAINGSSSLAVAFLLIWGVAVVSTVDNLLKPLFISNVTRISFLPILIGIMGGLAQFGLIGLFIGPVIIVLSTELWKNLIARLEKKQ